MKVHVKAALYEELKKDFEELLNELTALKVEMENIPNRDDIQAIKETQGQGSYYAACVGCYGAVPFGLGIKIAKHEGVLNWYKSKK